MLALLPTVALAQQQRQRPSRMPTVARLAARSADGRNTTFYDAMGRNTGRSVTSGGTTTVYDQMGRQLGNITKGR